MQEALKVPAYANRHNMWAQLVALSNYGQRPVNRISRLIKSHKVSTRFVPALCELGYLRREGKFYKVLDPSGLSVESLRKVIDLENLRAREPRQGGVARTRRSKANNPTASFLVGAQLADVLRRYGVTDIAGCVGEILKIENFANGH